MSNIKINIIFESDIRGHVLEYLHNIYMYAIHSEDNFVFLLPRSFEEFKSNLHWPESENVSFHFITETEAEMCNHPNVLKSALERSRCIRKYAKELKADNVFLIFLIRTMPFLPFYLPRKTKASGIIYSIPLYKSGQSRGQNIKDKVIYRLFARKKNIRNIFMLNDPRSAAHYNEKYGTDKFLHLTDPIPEIDMSQVKNMREELEIPTENTIYLQFGSIDSRKNSLNILRALTLMTPEELKGKTVIFMGRMNSYIKEDFNKLVAELSDKVQIIVNEGFVPYDYLNSMCYTADVILTIYNNVEMSSGSIGYAAYFGKTVVGPSAGLLGNLIKDNNLGITIDNVTPENIKQTLLANVRPLENNYKVTHTVKVFCETILTSLK